MNSNSPSPPKVRRSDQSGAVSPQASARRSRRPKVNITLRERAARIAVGVVATIAGLVLLTGAGSLLAWVLELLLVGAGVDLIVTGALGHCPLYRKLGYVPPSLRSPT